MHVSIVNWIKGTQEGKKKLSTQLRDKADGEWSVIEHNYINRSLSSKSDTSKALVLKANERPKWCFQGQNPVNEGFFLEPEQALALLEQNLKNRDVLFPYMIGRDLVEDYGPSRWIIDFGQRDLIEAMKYVEPFAVVKSEVMSKVLDRAEKEKEATGKDKTRWTRMADRWWRFRDYQPGTMAAIAAIPRYIACSRTTRRPIFEFVSSSVHPDTKLTVFSLPDDYSFGIIQSFIHWEWANSRGGTLKGDFSYTSDSVFNPFPWPQKATLDQVRKVDDAAVALRHLRRSIMAEHGWSLRDLYRTLDGPGLSSFRTAHEKLDAAVRTAYGMKAKANALEFLLELNAELADREATMRLIVGPGLPPVVNDQAPFITTDCITANASGVS